MSAVTQRVCVVVVVVEESVVVDGSLFVGVAGDADSRVR